MTTFTIKMTLRDDAIAKLKVLDTDPSPLDGRSRDERALTAALSRLNAEGLLPMMSFEITEVDRD